MLGLLNTNLLCVHVMQFFLNVSTAINDLCTHSSTFSAFNAASHQFLAFSKLCLAKTNKFLIRYFALVYNRPIEFFLVIYHRLNCFILIPMLLNQSNTIIMFWKWDNKPKVTRYYHFLFRIQSNEIILQCSFKLLMVCYFNLDHNNTV